MKKKLERIDREKQIHPSIHPSISPSIMETNAPKTIHIFKQKKKKKKKQRFSPETISPFLHSSIHV
ncbi:hypothetical protein EAF00_007172 [Botryotinia globosa]|nr:hypothetical protein EAF00_007172 [Botryotinia globosa]